MRRAPLHSLLLTLAMVGSVATPAGAQVPADSVAAAIRLGADHVAHGRFDAAKERFEWARSVASGGDPLVASLLGLAEVARHGPDARPAQALAEQAAAIVDTLRYDRHDVGPGLAPFGGRLAAYEAVMQALIQRGTESSDFMFTAGAMRWAEHARARELNDLLEAGGREARHDNVPGLPEAQALLAPDEALLEFATGDSASWVWIVRSDRWTLRRLPTRRVLSADVRAVLADLSSAATAETPAAIDRSRRLFRGLLPGIGEFLAGVRRLRIVADGDVALLPFEALATAMPAIGKRAPYVVEQFDVSYAPSLASMMTPPNLHSEPVAMAVGATPLEVAALARVLGPDHVRSLSGADAEWSALAGNAGLSRARLVQFGSSGRLDATALLGVPLSARLVMLSATGIRPRSLDLPRALLAAGAESVVFGLWKGGDAGSARLLEGFYRRLLKEGLRRDAALAGAKRELFARPGTRSPHAWGRLVLFGAPGPIGF